MGGTLEIPYSSREERAIFSRSAVSSSGIHQKCARTRRSWRGLPRHGGRPWITHASPSRNAWTSPPASIVADAPAGSTPGSLISVPGTGIAPGARLHPAARPRPPIWAGRRTYDLHPPQRLAASASSTCSVTRVIRPIWRCPAGTRSRGATMRSCPRIQLSILSLTRPPICSISGKPKRAFLSAGSPGITTSFCSSATRTRASPISLARPSRRSGRWKTRCCAAIRPAITFGILPSASGRCGPRARGACRAPGASTARQKKVFL